MLSADIFTQHAKYEHKLHQLKTLINTPLYQNFILSQESIFLMIIKISDAARWNLKCRQMEFIKQKRSLWVYHE